MFVPQWGNLLFIDSLIKNDYDEQDCATFKTFIAGQTSY